MTPEEIRGAVREAFVKRDMEKLNEHGNACRIDEREKIKALLQTVIETLDV